MRFYKNLKDDLHCFQAAIKIVLSKHYPNKEFSFSQINRATGFKKNSATWDSRGLLWLTKQGFEIERISDFDYHRFAKQGEKYLKWFWRPDVYEWQSKNANFNKEQEAVKALLPYISHTFRKATIRDIERAYMHGYDIIASVNARMLDRRKGYTNHSVVVVGITKLFITFHDPGLPPEPNRRVSKRRFGKALSEVIALRQIAKQK